MRKLRVVVLVLIAVLPAGVAAAQEPPRPLKQTKAGELGTILTGPTGMTLYTFVTDKGDGKSTCNGACARKWPPFTPARDAPAPAEPLSLVTRDDGGKQYAWKGKPLYYYAEDTKPGETTGQNAGKAWFVVQP
jgi:predicted lipoprotein with Yx(FWY)xxD motif